MLVKYGLRELAHERPSGHRRAQAGQRRVAAVDRRRRLPAGAAPQRRRPPRRRDALGRPADHRRRRPWPTRLAVGLDEENRARQAIEREMLDEAIAPGRRGRAGSASRHSIVLALAGVSSRRRRHRRARAWSSATTGRRCSSPPEDGRGRARLRSQHRRRRPLRGALAACRDCLERFGGSSHGGGPEHPARSRRRVRRSASMRRSRRARSPEDFMPQVDDRLRAAAARRRRRAASPISDRLEPFGIGNPEPRLPRSRRARARSAHRRRDAPQAAVSSRTGAACRRSGSAWRDARGRRRRSARRPVQRRCATSGTAMNTRSCDCATCVRPDESPRPAGARLRRARDPVAEG